MTKQDSIWIRVDCKWMTFHSSKCCRGAVSISLLSFGTLDSWGTYMLKGEETKVITSYVTNSRLINIGPEEWMNMLQAWKLSEIAVLYSEFLPPQAGATSHPLQTWRPGSESAAETATAAWTASGAGRAAVSGTWVTAMATHRSRFLWPPDWPVADSTVGYAVAFEVWPLDGWAWAGRWQWHSAALGCKPVTWPDKKMCIV